MAFCYIVMQALPTTLPDFQTASSSISTLADILYGRKRYVVHVYSQDVLYTCCIWSKIVCVFSVCRVIRQEVTPGVSILGGLSQKVLVPADVEALSKYLSARGLNVPPNPHTTLYRINFRGHTYYSSQYERVKKRNSYTIAYLDNGVRKYASIKYFLYTCQKVLAVLNPLLPLELTFSETFGLHTALSSQSFIPVRVADKIELCCAEDILTKCLLLDMNSILYIVMFPSTLIYDWCSYNVHVWRITFCYWCHCQTMDVRVEGWMHVAASQ